MERLPEGVMIPAGNLEATEALEEPGAELPDAVHVAAELGALPRELGDEEIPEAVMAYRHAATAGCSH